MALFSIETYGELHPHLEQEWLITNGIGGFASSSLVGCNTRRYHGLLCAAMLPPVGRVIMLSRMGEMIKIAGREHEPLEFGISQFGDVFHRRGDRYLRRFELDVSSASWVYEIDGIKVTKEIQMPWRHNVTGIRYTVDAGDQEIELSLSPFVRMMDFHALRQNQDGFQDQHTARSCTLKFYDLVFNMSADAGAFQPQPDWWFGHTYAIEVERGQDSTENLYTPGKFSVNIRGKQSITLWAGSGDLPKLDWDAEIARRRDVVKFTTLATPTVQRLFHAANDFVVARKAPDGSMGSTVIAGYPWFADWGRDTMISLPGLFLQTARFEEARQVLSLFAQYVSEGMIPNRFDDYTNDPSYNTVDASLWFIHAVFEYVRLSGDSRTFDSVLRPACKKIIDGYTSGTRYNIKVDPADGLVNQGDSSTQLTWMDAKCDGVCFTPRQGKAVEINALWYHALCLMGEDARAKQVRESFVKAFWLDSNRGLADVIDGDRRDTAIRPNQIFAVSLQNSPLSREQQVAVVEVVKRELLTPVGLRTLSREDPGYRSIYRGPQVVRDAAYHNGTVWAWPIGAFLEAHLRVNDRSAESIAQARRWLEPLLETMTECCIGQIAEIFEANEPHRPVGCFAQAWSVAEALRLAMELGM